MKLIKVEHKEKGTWYFTTKAKAVRYINTSPNYLDHCLIVDKQCKGWDVDVIESDDVLSKYIDPERKYI